MYLWWRTWHDDDRRFWAEKFTSGDPAEARRLHREHLRFEWAEQLNAPGVTTLDFTDEKGLNKIVAGGAERLSDTDRAWYAALTPAPEPEDDGLPF